MRLLLLILGICVGIAGIEKPVEAQNYPWCAQYDGGSNGGAMNCGFVSFEQCLATVSGIGGFCIQNNTYQPPSGPIHQLGRKASIFIEPNLFGKAVSSNDHGNGKRRAVINVHSTMNPDANRDSSRTSRRR